ncbi:hypothetical protein QE152_g33455 [Popillia japonica]|uniref:Uncharacterized protein n=1 Tax=Popillia japonica TaxID=7064 RepID=A0AAW1IWU6_POPJA
MQVVEHDRLLSAPWPSSGRRRRRPSQQMPVRVRIDSCGQEYVRGDDSVGGRVQTIPSQQMPVRVRIDSCGQEYVRGDDSVGGRVQTIVPDSCYEDDIVIVGCDDGTILLSLLCYYFI